MKLNSFSPKQFKVLTWWLDDREKAREAVICDGAVRSGKTLCMGVSFFLWAMSCFHHRKFGLCGKTIASLRRNLVDEVREELTALGCQWEDKRSRNLITARMGGRENDFYLFGGRDEGSAAHIQGVTLAGVLLDEAALMPRSFVEQALARCSVEGSKAWFSCNPDGPEHWFYKEWIQKLQEHNALYIHFTMKDNPSLSPKMLTRYQRRFTGVFYRRFILGEWVAAEGRVYDFFDASYVKKPPEGLEHWCVSCDYGTANPTSMGLWGRKDGKWYRFREYYYDSRKTGRQKTDGEYAADLRRLAGGRRIERVVVDPSAASFIETLRREGWPVEKAENDVVSGIRATAQLLRTGELVICEGCDDAVREFALYAWDPDSDEDRVIKKFDHAMDDIRYFAATVAARHPEDCFSVGYVERPRF